MACQRAAPPPGARVGTVIGVRPLTTIAILGVVAGGAGASNGCGCGPIAGAYLTPRVVALDGDAWRPGPALATPRAFAVALPVDGARFVVAGGFTADQPGDVAYRAASVELCAAGAGCAPLALALDDRALDAPLPFAVGVLPDGTAVSSAGIVRDVGGALRVQLVRQRVVQLGAEVVAEGPSALAVWSRGDAAPRAIALAPGARLVAAVDDHRVLVVTDADHAALIDVRDGTATPTAGPGIAPTAVVALGDGAGLVFGARGVRRYDAAADAWRDVAALAGGGFTPLGTLADGALVATGDPDVPIDATAPSTYRLYRYRAADDALVPLPATDGYDVGATWLELPGGAVLRVGGAHGHFDDEETLAAG